MPRGPPEARSGPALVRTIGARRPEEGLFPRAKFVWQAGNQTLLSCV